MHLNRFHLNTGPFCHDSSGRSSTERCSKILKLSAFQTTISSLLSHPDPSKLKEKSFKNNHLLAHLLTNCADRPADQTVTVTNIQSMSHMWGFTGALICLGQKKERKENLGVNVTTTVLGKERGCAQKTDFNIKSELKLFFRVTFRVVC